MTKLRIVTENAADAAVIVASTTAGALTTLNMRSEVKAEVWRATTTSATLTLTWADARTLSMFALAFSNLTANAKFRIRGYALPADSVEAFDTGLVLSAAYAPLGQWEWGTESLGVNAFAYGGGSYASSWFTPYAVRKLVVDIEDFDNPAGYIEASRCISGVHWSPRHNATYGVQWKIVDSTEPERSEAGDRRSEAGHKHRWLSLDLARLTPEDRAYVMGMIWGGGKAKPFFLSVFPQKTDDPLAEQAYQLWCALADDAAMVHPAYRAYSKTLTVEEM